MSYIKINECSCKLYVYECSCKLYVFECSCKLYVYECSCKLYAAKLGCVVELPYFNVYMLQVSVCVLSRFSSR